MSDNKSLSLITVAFEHEGSGDSFEIEIKPRDVLAWERERGNGRGLSDLRNAKMADIYGIAFHSLIRVQKFSGQRGQFESEWDVNVVNNAVDDETP